MSAFEDTITILVADDDEEDRMLFQDAFEESLLSSYDLRFVEDGQQLMDYLNREGAYGSPDSAPRPGIILLDLNMPKKDGREVLAEIKANPRLSCIPIIVMTTSGAERDILGTYNLGVNSLIRKPDSFDELIQIMRIIKEYWFGMVELPAYLTAYHE
jgi:CheY-like chemotaxis protein